MYDSPDWKPVQGYEDIYVVSKYGEVARLPGFVITRKGHRQRVNGGVLKKYNGQVDLCVNRKVERFDVFRLVAESFIPGCTRFSDVYKIQGDSDALDNLSLDCKFYTEDPDWYTIPGYEGYYQIKKDGSVRSIPRYVSSVNHGVKCKVYKPGTNIVQSIDNCGYMDVGLTKDGKSKMWSVHRLVAMTFIPNPFNKPDVNHIDGNKLNNHVDNLEWCTKSENMQHAMKLGLWDPKYSGYRSAVSTGIPVICLDDNRKFISIHEAARYYNISADAVTLSLKYNRPFKGHMFSKLNNDDSYTTK